MSALASFILAAAARMERGRGEYAAQVKLAAPPEDATSLAAVDQSLDHWLALAAEVRAGDQRRRACFLLGRITFSLCECLAGPALDGIWLELIPPAAVALRPRRVEYEEDGVIEADLVFDLWVDADALAAGDDPVGFGKSLEALLTPLVEGLHQRSRLARAAFWREAADWLAASLLNQGKELDRVEAAMSAATQVIRQTGLRLANRQTDFLQVTLPERPDIAEWFRERGGCCRVYTSPGEEHCTTCVLRDRDSRIERLREHLRLQHGLTT
jgi:hypothetical protein